MKTLRCQITRKELPASQLMRGTAVRPNVLSLMRADYPTLDENLFVSIDVVNEYRKKYLEQILKQEVGELSELEKEVVQSIHENELLSANIENNLNKNLSVGERVADRIALFGGSWTFIICFFLFILTWIGSNVFILVARPFDSYPFILLNLILSCLAAIQAPIIMMSQNRQEAKDRLRSEHDYKINLKAELEIRLLHEKIDHLILQQNQRLLEIQQIQIDLMEDIMNKISNKDTTEP